MSIVVEIIFCFNLYLFNVDCGYSNNKGINICFLQYLISRKAVCLTNFFSSYYHNSLSVTYVSFENRKNTWTNISERILTSQLSFDLARDLKFHSMTFILQLSFADELWGQSQSTFIHAFIWRTYIEKRERESDDDESAWM